MGGGTQCVNFLSFELQKTVKMAKYVSKTRSKCCYGKGGFRISSKAHRKTAAQYEFETLLLTHT